jgi:hypothetical protein
VNLFDKRFVINTGKGGVGKSTISAAMALAAARRGKRVLAIELNTRERISRLFGAPEVGSEIKPIHDNVWAVNITPDAAMKEYVLMKLRIEMVYRAVFENRFVKQFLRVIPGLNELVLIGKAWYHEQERDKRGRPVYDFIVVDAPATGHGIFFLKIPHVITEAVPSGPMSSESRKIIDLLQDPQRTALNLITLTEEMPVNETIELRQVVDATLDIPMGYLIANGIYPRLFTPKEAAELEHLSDSRAKHTDLTGRLLDIAIFRSQRNDLQERYLNRLQREVGMPLIEVPYYFEPELDFDVISRIASHIEESVERRTVRP